MDNNRSVEELIDGAEVDRHREDLAVVLGIDVMHIAGEGRELIDILPDPLVRRMKEVSAVSVVLDASFWLDLAVGVTPDVITALDDRNVEAELCRRALRDGQAEEA